MGGAGSSPGFLWRRGRRERGGEEVSKGEVPPGIPQGGLSPFFFTVDVFFELKVICDQVCLDQALHPLLELPHLPHLGGIKERLTLDQANAGSTGAEAVGWPS